MCSLLAVPTLYVTHAWLFEPPFLNIVEPSEANGPRASPISDANTKVEEILDNINGYIHGPVSGFILKHFSKFESAISRNAVNVQKAAGSPSPEDFLYWFCSFSAEDHNRAQGM